NLADAVAIIVRDVKVAGTVNGCADRISKQRAGSGSAVSTLRRTREAGLAGRSSHGAYVSGSVDFPDDKIIDIGDVEVTRPVNCNRSRLVESRVERGAAVATESYNAGARDGGDGAIAQRAGNFTNAIIELIYDVDVSRGIFGNPVRSGQGRAKGRATISPVAATCNGRDDARGSVDLSNALVLCVGDGDGPGTIHENAHRNIELCRGSLLAITRETLVTGASHGVDDLRRRIDEPQAVILSVGNVNIVGAVDPNTLRSPKIRIYG